MFSLGRRYQLDVESCTCIFKGRTSIMLRQRIRRLKEFWKRMLTKVYIQVWLRGSILFESMSVDLSFTLFKKLNYHLKNVYYYNNLSF